jgi:hypothetical protein
MNNKDIIISSNKTITKYSANLIKRGLNLATLIEKTKLSLRKSTYLERGISLYKKEEYEQALDCFVLKKTKIHNSKY